ncbi:MAG: YraN family protein [Candidatus Excrementavichristensenella sp.]|nr:YraN family protein [Bacillota bacterium]
MNNAAFGAAGERAAEKYLKKRGAKVLARNFRCPFGEIDLIVKLDGRICFVEVKARSSESHGRPAFAVDREKRARIIKSAAWYLKGRGLSEAPIRFDVVEISPQGLRHIPAAFPGDIF